MKFLPQGEARRGFTLIELLVVIAIIAILAAILFPVFAQARSKARQITGTSNARQAAMGILQYVQDYDEKFPRAGWGCESAANDDAGDGSFAPGEENSCGATEWQNVTYPYVKNGGIYTSPGDASHATFDWGTDLHSDDGNFSLLINDLLSHQLAGKNGFTDRNAQTRKADGLSLAAVNAPADCVLLMEGHCGWNKLAGSSSAGALGLVPATGKTCGQDKESKWCKEQSISGYQTALFCPHAYDGASYQIGSPFYQDGGNVAFSDGHVKYTKYTDGNGNPLLCATLPWTKHLDPLQRGADNTAAYCATGGPNPPGDGAIGNWN